MLRDSGRSTCSKWGFSFILPRLLCKLSRFQETVVATEKMKNKQNTHVWPHCVVTGLSKISRQTGQTNSDTSLLPSGFAFLCCAALKPPSIAISFFNWFSPPVMTSPSPAPLHARRRSYWWRLNTWPCIPRGKNNLFYFNIDQLGWHSQNFQEGNEY